ncbi:major facilitator superfamily domain-containing protein [Whalleya microplaca]|nr:major facilitator superfamily domain-containing protein [Whalleya microplaca]
MLGSVGMTLNLGACVGPVIGGAVAYTSGSYVWLFWALVIVAVVLFGGVGLLLPETARTLIGNGGDYSQYKWWQLSWLNLMKRCSGYGSRTIESSQEKAQNKSVARKYGLINILSCFRIIFHKDTLLALWIHGSFYTVDYAFVASLPDIFKEYGFNELYIGLAYLPRGVGLVVGSYFTGKLMDRNYRVTARQSGFTTDKVVGDDLLQFPIEKARSRSNYWMLVISTSTVISYGWAVQYASHFSIALVLQFMQGFWGTYFYTTYNASLVDSFPQSPSTGAAATSITRCAMAAAGTALLQPLLDVAGRGWYFTALALWSGLFGTAAVILLRMKGMGWRRARNGL